MQQNEQGRFCTSCQKTVIDFSQYSDAMLYEFISKNSGHICGRFRAHQLNRNISITPQPHSRLYRMFIGLGLTLLLVPASQQVKAQAYTPVVEGHTALVYPASKARPGNNAVELKGRIYCEDSNHHFSSGEITIMQDERTIAEVVADANGYYSIYFHPCTYDIIAEAEGYMSATRKKITVRENPVNELDFTLKVNPNYRMAMGGMRIHNHSNYAKDNCSARTRR